MLFVSFEFLALFFPITIGVYYLLGGKARNYWLFAASLFFYAWGEPVYVVIMLFSIAYNYCMALAIERKKGYDGIRKILIIITAAVNIGVLFVFKYLNFLIHVLHGVLPFTAALIPQTHIALPIGISFFTFQAMSYVIDVYRGIPAQKNPAYLGLYISMFPQLIAGPIVRYTTVMEEIEDRRFTIEDFFPGCIRFLMGFNKKILLANTLSEVAEYAFGAGELSTGMAWVGAVCYAFQIFFDFSGYSDMAIGLGKMFGFHFDENFRYPYISQTVTEFWRRWHISLGTWFRDYVYFPLGGSRVDTRRKLIQNLMVVWMLTGIWHGANWTFIVWGLFYGVIIIVEKLLNIPKWLEKQPFPVHVPFYLLTMFFVLIGWVFFNSPSIGFSLDYIGSMLRLRPCPPLDETCLHYLHEYRLILLAAALCSTPVFSLLRKRLCGISRHGETASNAAAAAVQLTLFVYSITCLVMNSHNPFIYFNF